MTQEHVFSLAGELDIWVSCGLLARGKRAPARLTAASLTVLASDDDDDDDTAKSFQLKILYELRPATRDSN